MYTIGQFSLITNTTKKALRHYDEIGLLKPSKTEDNLYRYYDDSKVTRIKLINELKSYGLPLAVIAQLLDHQDSFSVEEVLSEQLHRLSQEIEALNRKKDNIMVRLSHGTGAAGQAAQTPIKVVQLEEEPVIALSYQADMEHFGEAIGRFYEHINVRQLPIRGDVMISRSSGDDSDVFDLQIFAYSAWENGAENRPFKSVGGKHCLHSSYQGFLNREDAYVRVFEYANEHELRLGERLIEKYRLANGIMTTDFYVEIIR